LSNKGKLRANLAYGSGVAGERGGRGGGGVCVWGGGGGGGVGGGRGAQNFSGQRIGNSHWSSKAYLAWEKSFSKRCPTFGQVRLAKLERGFTEYTKWMTCEETARSLAIGRSPPEVDNVRVPPPRSERHEDLH